jgi:hypothetical protein
MRPDDRVIAAIENCYRVFSRYGRPSRLESSPLRDGGAILKTLTAAPLNELGSEAIGPYAGWALTTVGGVNDYKHFLPRIFEEAVKNNVWMGTDPSVIAERLKRADWRTWPADEQGAVVDLFSEAWKQSSRQHPDLSCGSDWLCGVATLGLGVSRLLDEWLTPLEVPAILQLASFLFLAPARLVGPHGSEDGFWDEVDETTCRSIQAWLAGRAVAFAFKWAAERIGPDDQWTFEQGQKVVAGLSH